MSMILQAVHLMMHLSLVRIVERMLFVVIAIGILTTMKFSIGFNENLILIGFVLLKAIGVFIALYLLGKYILPAVFQKASESIELVFIVGLGWMFFGVLLAFALDFSIAIGAFIAGVSISMLPFSFEIKDRTQGLRDFSLILFFSTIGTQLLLSKELFLASNTLILAVVTVILSPLIIAFITSFFGFDKKNIFIISLIPNQVSEFSFILIVIGIGLGHINSDILTILTTVAIITILISSILSYNINPVFKRVRFLYSMFEWRKKKSKQVWKNHIVIFGVSELGVKVAKYFKNKDIIFVDNDPTKLDVAKGARCEMIYGDTSESNTWFEAHLDKAKIFINTVGNLEADLELQEWLKKHNKKIVTITETDSEKFAKILRKEFDFVLYKEDAKWDKLKGALKKWS